MFCDFFFAVFYVHNYFYAVSYIELTGRRMQNGGTCIIYQAWRLCLTVNTL